MKYCNSCMNLIEEQNVNCSSCGKKIDVEIPSHHLTPGTVLNNKFVVGAALGEGGFGITYIGRDIKLDMKVAIKEYYPNGYVNRSNAVSSEVHSSSSAERKAFFEAGRERFLNEARILAKFCGSIGIVDVRDFFEENNTVYIVMEYLEGKTLKEYLNEKGTLTPEHTINLLMPVMESLDNIHTQGLIHRDISPDNIMLFHDKVKLLDFGAARNVFTMENKSLTVMLKPGYAPEEQYRSKGEQGAWTDVYALCATMYKCITGIIPEDSTQRVINDGVKKPSELGINIEPVIEQTLMKGLEVNPKHRYQTIEDLLAGFKGLEKLDNVNIKTICGNDIPVAKDDKVMVYQETGSDESKTVAREFDATKEKQECEIVIENALKKSHSRNRKKRHSNKRFGITLLSAVLVVVGIVSIITIYKALGSITIAGNKVSKNDTSVSLRDETITVEDMKALVSMGKLEQLSFLNCELDNSSMEYLKNISSVLTSLTLQECIGFTDYSSISDLKYLRELCIIGCNLTNKQFKDICFDNKEYLTCVDLSKNEELSDLSTLCDAKLLNELIVDNTNVIDFSILEDCEILCKVSANGCGIVDISTLVNKTITELYVNDNEISDITSLTNFEVLSTLEIKNNKIVDISALADKKLLSTLHLDGNQIADISALSATPNLYWLQINDNKISTLQPLSSVERLGHLYANCNSLTNLEGLESALELKTLEAAENQIEDINGLTNCTILEEFNVNSNNISDISLLKKSAATLKKVYFNQNNVSDISALTDASNLEYISFDNNKVTTLDALKSSINLLSISAEYNEIMSMDGLSNSTKLKYIYLPHNKIDDMSAISNLVSREVNDFAIIDLSSNNISELCLSTNKKYTYLAIYNNPMKSFDKVKEIKGTYFLFSYVENMDLTGFDEAFNYYNIIDCPKDKQVGIENAIYDIDYISISNGVMFSTVEEADKQMHNVKSAISTGTTKQEETTEE